DGESQNYEGENGPQGAHTSVHENFGAEQSSGEDAEHHGHGHTGVDESAAEVDARTGGGGNSDHEIAGGSGDLKGDAHDAIHGDDFDSAGADTKEAGECTRAEHEAEAGRDIAHSIFL